MRSIGHLTCVISAALLFVIFLWSPLLWAEERTVIIGLRGDHPSMSAQQGDVQALEAWVVERGGRVEHVYQLIDALAVRLSEQELVKLRQDPYVRYVVPDGTVATPEYWAGPSFPKPGSSRVFAEATPAEFYPWGIERIRAPAVHRTRAARDVAWWGIPLALALVGMLGRRDRPFARRRRTVTVTWVGFALASFLSGCTWVAVVPHPGIMGEGIEIAVLDTGIDLGHPDLKANVRGGVDLVNRDDVPQDDNGHGTGVAGILAAAQDGRGLIGVAPGIKLWAVKMLRYDEQGSIADLIRGIEWAVDQGVEIINMSLGTNEDNPALHEAIKAAYARGVLLVAASGNQGDRVLYPAAYPEVIAVAATDKRDRRAWFSNMGPQVELAAPGAELLTTGLEGGYQVVNGTSFAVPHVTGTAALLFATGLRDAQAVRQRLAQSAEDLGLSLSAQGYGLVDAERAVLSGK